MWRESLDVVPLVPKSRPPGSDVASHEGLPRNQSSADSALSFLWTSTKGFDPHKEIHLVGFWVLWPSHHPRPLPTNMYCLVHIKDQENPFFLAHYVFSTMLLVSYSPTPHVPFMLTFLLTDPRQSVS